jgi:hypothetical protein
MIKVLDHPFIDLLSVGKTVEDDKLDETKA